MNTELLKELEDQHSVLGSIPKQVISDNSELPIGYFDGMEDRVMARLLETSAPKAATVSLWERYNVGVKLAAMTTIAVLGLGIFSLLKKDNSELQYSQLEIQRFLSDEGEINTIESTDTVLAVSSIDFSSLSKEEIQKYLIENEDLDINSI